MVLTRELQRGLDGLAAAVGEEHAVEVTGRELGNAGGKLDRAWVRVGPAGEVAEVLGLLCTGLDQVVATVAQLRAEQRSETIEVALAVLVVDVAAVAAHDDRDLVLSVVLTHPGEVHP